MNSNNLTALLSVLTIATTLGYHRESQASAELASRVEKLEEVCKQQDAMLMSLGRGAIQYQVDIREARESIERLRGDDAGARVQRRVAQILRKAIDDINSLYFKSAEEKGLKDWIRQWRERITEEWSD